MVFNDLDPTMFKLVGLRPGFYHPSFNQNLSVLVPDYESTGRKQRIVRHLKRCEAEVTHLETVFTEWFQLERAESAAFEVLVLELGNTPFMDSDLDAEIVKNSQGVMAYMVGVHVRNNYGIDIRRIAQIL